jgi:hypothetical protein
MHPTALTRDRHVRICASGEIENLHAIRKFLILFPHDPEKNKQAEEEYYVHNQQVAKLLEEKGFVFFGNEPRLMIINRYLHVNKVERETKQNRS